MVVVEMETGCDVASSDAVAVASSDAEVVVVVEVVVVGVRGATRMQQRTPRLRARAPSTPTCKGNG